MTFNFFAIEKNNPGVFVVRTKTLDLFNSFLLEKIISRYKIGIENNFVAILFKNLK